MAILSYAATKSILPLAEKREKLLAEVAQIESQIEALSLGEKGTTKRTYKQTRTAAKHGRRGSVKDVILPLLEAAGNQGLSAKEIAERLRMKPQNVYVWMGTTGKKLGVQKAGSQYVLKK